MCPIVSKIKTSFSIILSFLSTPFQSVTREKSNKVVGNLCSSASMHDAFYSLSSDLTQESLHCILHRKMMMLMQTKMPLLRCNVRDILIVQFDFFPMKKMGQTVKDQPNVIALISMISLTIM